MCAGAEFGRSNPVDNKDTLFVQDSFYFSNTMEARAKAKVIDERDRCIDRLAETPTPEVM